MSSERFGGGNFCVAAFFALAVAARPGLGDPAISRCCVSVAQAALTPVGTVKIVFRTCEAIW